MPSNKNNVSNSDTTNNVSEVETVAVTATSEKTTPKENNTKLKQTRYNGVTSFVYIGPFIPKNGLKSNSVLCGTYDEIIEYYKDVITLYPCVAKLIVPVSKLAELREKVQKSGNAMNVYYTEALIAINKNKKKNKTEGE